MAYESGPDQIIPTKNLSICDIEGVVKIKDIEETRRFPPISIIKLLHDADKKYGDCPALATKHANGTWKKTTYKEYHQKVRTCAKAFIHLGLNRYHSVCIIGFNSEEWFIADLAAIYAGGIAVGVYPTNLPEACFYCLNSSRANIVVVEDAKQLDKILAIRSRLPELKAIIQYSGTPPSDPMIYNWEQLMDFGRCQPDSILEYVTRKIAINQCCTIVFTSGTVGNPKAVMLSHDNILYPAKVFVDYMSISEGDNAIITYLPMSHVAGQILDIYIAIVCGATVYFADKMALKGSLVNTMQEVHPNQFLGVPRIWEKMYEKLTQMESQSSLIKKTISNWAKRYGLQYNLNKMNGRARNTWTYYIAKHLVLDKIKSCIGLNEIQNCMTGAAPLSHEIKKFFLSLDIVLLELYGMSEVAGPHTVSTNDFWRLDSVGKCLPGLSIKILNPDKDGNGEICMNGRNVFMGYLNEPDKTKEAIDDDGWVHSGDIGKLDIDGFLYVTGRIKELLITAGGENIAPVNIETLVLEELPYISNALLVGDRRKFLAILLTLKTDTDPETGKPLDALMEQTKSWLQELGCEDETVTEVLANKHPKLMEVIKQGIDKVNEKAISNAQRVQKFQILPADFSIATGELGPTLKLKRGFIEKKYLDIIESFYS